MKAKVKKTGQIVEVLTAFDHRGGAPAIVYEVLGHPEIKYRPEELEFYVTFDYIEEVVSQIQTVNIGYWEKLEHQYAGMAMQSYVSNNEYLREIRKMCKEPQEMRDLIADLSILLATTLIQKLKEKEEK